MKNLDPEWANVILVGVGVGLTVWGVFVPIDRSETVVNMANFLAGMGARGLGTAIANYYRDDDES